MEEVQNNGVPIMEAGGGNSSSSIRSIYIVNKFKKDLEKTGMVLIAEVEGMLRKCIDEGDKEFPSNPSDWTENVGTAIPISEQSPPAVLPSRLRKKVAPSPSQAKVTSPDVVEDDSSVVGSVRSGATPSTGNRAGGRTAGIVARTAVKRRVLIIESSDSDDSDWSPDMNKAIGRSSVSEQSPPAVLPSRLRKKVAPKQSQAKVTSTDVVEDDSSDDVVITLDKAVVGSVRSGATTSSGNGKRKGRRRAGTVALTAISRQVLIESTDSNDSDWSPDMGKTLGHGRRSRSSSSRGDRNGAQKKKSKSQTEVASASVKMTGEGSSVGVENPQDNEAAELGNGKSSRGGGNGIQKKKRSTKSRVIRPNDLFVNTGLKKVKLESDWVDQKVKTEQDSMEDLGEAANAQRKEGVVKVETGEENVADWKTGKEEDLSGCNQK